MILALKISKLFIFTRYVSLLFFINFASAQIYLKSNGLNYLLAMFSSMFVICLLFGNFESRYDKILGIPYYTWQEFKQVAGYFPINVFIIIMFAYLACFFLIDLVKFQTINELAFVSAFIAFVFSLRYTRYK